MEYFISKPPDLLTLKENVYVGRQIPVDMVMRPYPFP